MPPPPKLSSSETPAYPSWLWNFKGISWAQGLCTEAGERRLEWHSIKQINCWISSVTSYFLIHFLSSFSLTNHAINSSALSPFSGSNLCSPFLSFLARISSSYDPPFTQPGTFHTYTAVGCSPGWLALFFFLYPIFWGWSDFHEKGCVEIGVDPRYSPHVLHPVD